MIRLLSTSRIKQVYMRTIASIARVSNISGRREGTLGIMLKKAMYLNSATEIGGVERAMQGIGCKNRRVRRIWSRHRERRTRGSVGVILN